MATDERKDRENQDKQGTRNDENVKDLSAKKLDEEKEGKVKGGYRETPIADEM